MSDASGNRRVFLVFILVLCTAGVSFGAADGDRRLVSPELLNRAGLKIVWDNKLPIDSAEKLEMLSIVGGKLYALSSRNYLISLGKDKGETVFSKYAAPVGQPVGEPTVYEDQLIWVLGNRVVTTDERTGDEISSQNIEYRLMCPAVRNSKYMYLSGIDKRLHVLREEGMVELFKASAGNDSIVNSIIAAENFVIFGTDAGNVISMLAGEPVRLWQFDAAGGVVGRLVLDDTSVFLSSKDTKIYRVDMIGAERVELAWKYQVAGVPENSPRVAKNAVYQYVRGKGLTAIDKESGSFLWSLGDGIELLAEVGSKAYVITNKETLTVMDNRAGSKLYSVNFRGVRRFAFNTGDSKIYIADERGRIACLQPVE